MSFSFPKMDVPSIKLPDERPQLAVRPQPLNCRSASEEIMGKKQSRSFQNHLPLANCRNTEDQEIEKEFFSLKKLVKEQGEKEVSAVALQPANIAKNRYPDVLPLEETRVRLTTIDEDDSDYINANHIRLGASTQHYICCQAPLPNTFADFWRMVWEKNSPVIVMLTGIIEKRRKKADIYWPEREGDVEIYGKFQVKHLKTVFVPGESIIIVRKFVLTNKDNESRNVVQLHYNDWPDQGVPDSTRAMTELIKELDIHKKGLNDPITVHCSAGIGRTGTFLAIHMALQEIATTKVKQVNIMKTVMDLRQQRTGLVQSKDQYKFVYATINDVLLNKYEHIQTESQKQKQLLLSTSTRHLPHFKPKLKKDGPLSTSHQQLPRNLDIESDEADEEIIEEEDC